MEALAGKLNDSQVNLVLRDSMTHCDYDVFADVLLPMYHHYSSTFAADDLFDSAKLLKESTSSLSFSVRRKEPVRR